MNLSIEINENNNSEIKLIGRLDTITATDFEKKLEQIILTVDMLTINCEDLVYISSAGLRVILKTYKMLASKKGLILTNVSDEVREVFEITGFSDFLTINWGNI